MGTLTMDLESRATAIMDIMTLLLLWMVDIICWITNFI